MGVFLFILSFPQAQLVCAFGGGVVYLQGKKFLLSACLILGKRARETGHLTQNRIKQKTMAKKLYVGGIPYSTTEDGLKAAFAQAGEVLSASIIIDKMTGRSKGFGFVEMANDADATTAIDMWNDKDFEGRTLTVNEARPLEERAPRREFGGGNRRM